MVYESKNWVDRSVEFPNRYIITCIDEANGIYEINRLEGKISEEGDALDSQNFNDQETRIVNAFELIESIINNNDSNLSKNMSSINTNLTQRIKDESMTRVQVDNSIMNSINELKIEVYKRLDNLDERVAQLERK